MSAGREWRQCCAACGCLRQHVLRAVNWATAVNQCKPARRGKPVGVPLDRVAVVHGAAGDVADALHGLAKDDLKWLPHDTLRWGCMCRSACG